MTNYSKLILEIDTRGVASIALNRPEVHNAFDAELISEITHVFRELEKHAQVRFVVLSGKGKSFCAGADLNWMRSMKECTLDHNKKDACGLSTMYETIRHFKKPVIAVVHGAVLGGGSGLAAVADYVLAADNATFGFTEVRLGILPAIISPYAIEKIGVSAARAYFISGMQIPAQTAKEIGLAHRIVALDELDMAREAIIHEFLKAGPKASQRAKELIDKVSAQLGNHSAVLQVTVNAISHARVSDEGQEGMDALLNGRTPNWIPS